MLEYVRVVRYMLCSVRYIMYFMTAAVVFDKCINLLCVLDRYLLEYNTN